MPLEVQIEPDPQMFGRLLEYMGRLWRAEKPSRERGDRFWIIGAVLNLTGTGRASQDYEWSKGGPRTLVRVAERNAAQESAVKTLAGIADGSISRALLALIPLMQGGGEADSIEEWIRLASAEPDFRRRSNYGALALIFAEAADDWEVWKQALKEWNMRESKQVLEWQAEARAEGRAEGRREERAASLIAFLEARFQSVPADLIQAIQSQTNPDTLLALIPLAARAESVESFRASAGL